ncbi:4Fe-4S dicluster domain-containing protein [Pseudodesulfovibrio sp. F-1]|uniref:4Fe-4S dicluster domain-containing protein n=1 Tax=Pseudodesulfovibrio alkaliphilus TaxID=2661613 RepID=A0A7K1KIX2_9BACT|nr:4Fe-4S dicluster domain-containing protein [Pseudodesulfovibrio alkaliphilus]MUM76017.1 4Fe-4S dicluster domain-containing protein [Pseudodesulfovibrio alkaliphilus]
MSETITRTWSPEGDETRIALTELRDMVGACMQCGTCTASCPNWYAMDVTPRRMWRMVQFGMIDDILKSRTFWLCSSCYMCTLRCPRGLRLTSAMGALKRLARLDGARQARRNGAFYEAFMSDVEANGRLQEASMMQGYFLRRMDPRLPMAFLPLGLRMLGKGKLHLPSRAQRGRLGPMFAKARQMEAGS